MLLDAFPCANGFIASLSHLALERACTFVDNRQLSSGTFLGSFGSFSNAQSLGR